ncbi:protein of unknown function [Bartonella clarridgeiae 73]|uniref:Uncharacterized protein n=1 Tax=Bartonella clarridgeiae (strain CCUG 45776 / CIP 104772 / 73) TaxID=696125 RepID=E6YGB6_BARC7|nr:protein of unknown function [Bartonella clarridgeiae 73]
MRYLEYEYIHSLVEERLFALVMFLHFCDLKSSLKKEKNLYISIH